MTLWMTAVHITAYTVGLHAAALGTHLAFMTTGASLNHAGYDFDIRFLGHWHASCGCMRMCYVLSACAHDDIRGRV